MGRDSWKNTHPHLVEIFSFSIGPAGSVCNFVCFVYS